MKWHPCDKGTGLPNIETDTVLCVVQYKYPVNECENVYEIYYEVMLFHKNTQSFSKPEDTKGIHGLRKDLVIRWAYIEEDDDVYQEQESLTAIYAAIQHVRSLFDCLLTYGMFCGKEHRDIVGLNELDQMASRKPTCL